jgi:hypothetical protein
MGKKTILMVLMVSWALPICLASFPSTSDFPAVLSMRDRADLVYRITQKRLEQLLPRFMRQTGFDMWIITCNEDNLKPIFKTMIPYENWCPITQILVFFDQGSEKGVERLNVSRSNFQGLYKNVWDAATWDTQKKESQWDCLGRTRFPALPRTGYRFHQGRSCLSGRAADTVSSRQVNPTLRGPLPSSKPWQAPQGVPAHHRIP